MIFFKEIPQALTLIGAGCMLVSVVIMAMPSTEPSTETETEEKAAAAPSAASVAATEEAQAPSTEDDATWTCKHMREHMRLIETVFHGRKPCNCRKPCAVKLPENHPGNFATFVRPDLGVTSLNPQQAILGVKIHSNHPLPCPRRR